MAYGDGSRGATNRNPVFDHRSGLPWLLTRQAGQRPQREPPDGLPARPEPLPMAAMPGNAMMLSQENGCTCIKNRAFSHCLTGCTHRGSNRDQGRAPYKSWNRIYVECIAARGNVAVDLKPWYRIPGSKTDDDKPDIDEYLGYGQLGGATNGKSVCPRSACATIFAPTIAEAGSKSAGGMGGQPISDSICSISMATVKA